MPHGSTGVDPFRIHAAPAELKDLRVGCATLSVPYR
jgi:hypothetical protein